MGYLGNQITTVFPTSISVDSATISGNTTVGGTLGVTGATTLSNTLGVTGVSTLSENIVFNASSKGVHLGVTSATASNLIDDYEEGTWTPTYIVDSGTNPTVTYNTDSTVGVYVKVGAFVHIQGRIRTNATSGGSGNLALGGLPFTTILGNNYYSTADLAMTNQWVADNFPVSGYIAQNNTEILLLKGRASDHRDGKGLIISVSNLTNGTNKNDIIFSATYRTS